MIILVMKEEKTGGANGKGPRRVNYIIIIFKMSTIG